MDKVEHMARAMASISGRDPDNIEGGPHPGGEWLGSGVPWWTGFKEFARVSLAAIDEPKPKIAIGNYTITELRVGRSCETEHAILVPADDLETQEDQTERKLASVTAPDNATNEVVLAAVLECARAWVPEARIMGNVRAGDIARAVATLLTPPPSTDVIHQLEERKLSAEDVQWVTNDIAELGVKIGNQFFFLYKGESLVYGALDPDPTVPPVHDDGTPMHWRPVFKREFGECAHPINYKDPTRIGTVSLADSDMWKPLPAANQVTIPTLAPGAGVAGHE
jgi:hypothetical protein